MKQLIKAGVAVLALLSLIGCFQVSTVIKVKPDGSGTIEETFLMNKEFVRQMRATMNQMAEQMEQIMTGQTERKEEQPSQESETKQAGELFDIFDEVKLRDKAGTMGKGVTYISGEKITTNKFEGYKAVYAFKDINKLRFNQNPGKSVPSAPGGRNRESGEKEEFVTFQFTRGHPSTLIIRMPDYKADGKPESSSGDFKKAQTDDQQSEMMAARMKKMFEGMKIALEVEVQGSIVETNATYREGTRITMMELDFGRLLEMPEEFKKFSRSKPETVEDAKKLMKDLPGIKVDLNKNVMIKFK